MEKQGITLIYGEDEWVKNEALKAIKAKTVDESDLMNYSYFEGKDIEVANIIDIGETMPFFAEQKLIVVKNSGYFKVGKKDDTQKLLDWLKVKPEYSLIVFVEQDVDKRNSLYKYIQKDFTAIEGNTPNDEALVKIIGNACKERGLNIDSGLIKYLAMNLPKQVSHILVELDKLASYVGDGKVTREAIDNVCIFSLEQRVFELLKAVSQNQTQMALGIYNKLIESKESPIGVLVLIGRQYRQLLQVKYLQRNNANPKSIGQTLGIPYYVAQDLCMQAQRFTFKNLQDILELCLESDEAIKTGKMEQVKCVEFLIIKCITLNHQ
ncbi:DNA polymerase III subunit delta [Niameybacter massiliensis]|uniref:DNA polymerase III subunit delta n=1 Tax=Niameybacter massiliensis TaxID=1658108 RepID=UPI0006B5E095|nr:DNA polymerase III subunit delta [Niameybacter massiliensis]